jgi:hypothetical protein
MQDAPKYFKAVQCFESKSKNLLRIQLIDLSRFLFSGKSIL